MTQLTNPIGGKIAQITKICAQRLGVGLLAYCILSCQHLPPQKSLKLGIWYWNSPFSLSATQKSQLHQIGITYLFIKTASFTTDGTNVLLKEPVQWNSKAKGFHVVLVFTVDVGLRGHFRHFPIATIVNGFSQGIQTEVNRAQKAGIRLSGVQIDFDCPTSQLTKYARVIKQTRKRIHFDGTFSITALQTWLSNSAYSKLARECNFIAPQFYEGTFGNTLESTKPIPDIDNITNGLQQASRPGKPVWAGLASYGHALVFSPNDHIEGIYHGLQPEDAFRLPALQYQETLNLKTSHFDGWDGETLAIFQAIHPDIHGRGIGTKIAFAIPSARTLKLQWQTFLQNRTSQCEGAIFYRFPQPNDQMALSLPTINAVVHAQPIKQKFKVTLHKKSDPYSLLAPHQSKKKIAMDYQVVVDDEGTEATRVIPRGFAIVIQFSQPGFDQLDHGQFDQVITGQINRNGQFVPLAQAQSNCVMLIEHNFVPGERIKSGTIVTGNNGSRAMHYKWRAISPNGSPSYFSGNVK